MMNIFDLLRKKSIVSIFDVAKYIFSKEENIDSLKLMRLCYYSQAWHLAWYNEPLFEEDFHAWVSGPCCLELYDFTRNKNLSEIKPKNQVKKAPAMRSDQGLELEPNNSTYQIF